MTLTLMFAALALLAPSLASAAWSSPIIVSGAGSSTGQTRVAGGSDGSSFVVWKREVGGFDLIQGTKVAVDGTQGPILALSPAGEDSTDPVIEARSDGSAMVGWINQSGASDYVQTATIAADGTAGAATIRSVAGPAGQHAKDLSVALGADGTAGLAWLRFNGVFWVVQAVKVAANGTSGTVHNLSVPLGSADTPDIAAAPPTVTGEPYSYRVVWPQGAGNVANVYSRAIAADDTTDGVAVLLWPRIPNQRTDPIGPGIGGDPHDVRIGYGSEGSLNIAWVRYRTDYVVNNVDDARTKNPFLDSYDPDDPDDTPYQNWAVEAIRGFPGAVLNNTQAQPIAALTPVVPGTAYNVDQFDMNVPFGGQPVMTWVHDINGGGQRVESGRYQRNGVYTGWVNGTPVVPAVENPGLVANKSGSAVSGWTVPGVVPDEDAMGMRRFSDGAIDQTFTPTGDFEYPVDPGFVVADNGVSLVAFTAIDGSSIGTSRIMVYTRPGIRVDPVTHNFGQSDIGVPRSLPITIRSTGETPVEVTGIALSGADADRYQMNGSSDCVRKIDPGTNCTVNVTFTPGSTSVQTAKVTVTSELGNDETDLTGSGLNRTRTRLTVTPRNAAVHKGKVLRIRVRAENIGGVASDSTKVCVNLRKRALKLIGSRCRSLDSLPAGASRDLDYRIRVTWRAPRGTRLPVTFRMRSGNAVVRQAVAQVRRKGR